MVRSYTLTKFHTDMFISFFLSNHEHRQTTNEWTNKQTQKHNLIGGSNKSTNNSTNSRCDKGYIEPFCVPNAPLPMSLREEFDQPVSEDSWPEIYGGEVTSLCGQLVSGTALTLYKVSMPLNQLPESVILSAFIALST